MLSMKRKALLSMLTLSGGLGVFVTSDDKRKRQAMLTAKSAYRVSNLVSTVATMCGDYGYQFYFKSVGSMDHFNSKKRLMSQLQHEVETYSIKLEQLSAEATSESPTGNPFLQLNRENDPEFLKQRIENANIMMAKVSADMVLLEQQNEHLFHDIHIRNAARLTQMCARNGGLYIKLGQHIAMLDYIVPPEYQKELHSLLGMTPQSSIESVRQVIRDEVGAYPEQIFDSFDPVPIASASLAQVHVATKNGVKYAVKVQHDGLAESAAVDMVVITKIVSIIPHLFKDFNYNWLSAEMNRNLPLELNFQCERENILKTTHLLQSFIAAGDVAVPKVNDSLSSKRMLTMSFEEGCYITNKGRIQDMGLSEALIAKTISTVFWEQIFRHGFVHCDPHEANILVRAHPHKKQHAQVVLLDHGLYRQLEEGFRLDYCRLWQGIVLGDKNQVERYCKKMNAGEAYALLAAVITQRPWDDIISYDMSRKQPKVRSAEAMVLRSYVEKYFADIVKLLGVVPSDMLLLFKTSDCLRHLDKILGSSVNTSAVAADVVAEVLLQADSKAAYATLSVSWTGALYSLIGAFTDYYNVKLRLYGFYWYNTWNYLCSALW